MGVGEGHVIFCMQIKTKVLYKSIVSLWVCVVRHAQSIQNNKFAISLQYLKENVKDEVDFNTFVIKVSYTDSVMKVIRSLLIGMIKHFQSTQSNKFVISLQYLKKEVRNGVHFLPVAKHQSWHYCFGWK